MPRFGRITEATHPSFNGSGETADVRTYVRIVFGCCDTGEAMRWDSQRVDREKGRSLPGLEVERVRTFDAPEALGINFHEVRAKSALNQVPGDYLPFNWTVNAFRGCSHACSYCQSGETPILMADGRPRGTCGPAGGRSDPRDDQEGKYRRYVTTEVLAHWETVKEAYRVTLEDGTELVASGDHRYWTRRGKWKHVIGAQQGPLQRPHLTINDHSAGIGRFAEGPDTDAPIYRRGYLCGLIRGDGNLGRMRTAARADRSTAVPIQVGPGRFRGASRATNTWRSWTCI